MRDVTGSHLLRNIRRTRGRTEDWSGFVPYMAMAVTYRERLELCRASVTLDGKPAAISGARLPFAKVAVLPNGAVREWPWESVREIVANGGRFESPRCPAS